MDLTSDSPNNCAKLTIQSSCLIRIAATMLRESPTVFLLVASVAKYVNIRQHVLVAESVVGSVMALKPFCCAADLALATVYRECFLAFLTPLCRTEIALIVALLFGLPPVAVGSPVLCPTLLHWSLLRWRLDNQR